MSKVRHETAKTLPKADDLFQKIFMLLRAQTGQDFSHYKQNTIIRRIERRMTVHQIPQLPDYVRYLQESPIEVNTLFKELLIGVTNFFRDLNAFVALKKKVIHKLIERARPGGSLRVWVPGCSTGEEAYSIAMLIQEHLDATKGGLQVQIFGTDIDSDAIELARAGIYPDSIVSDVPAEYLERFFTREESSFRVKKSVREWIVFSRQNLAFDPPFSRIDLISCRNLLIYMGSELQQRVIPLFHYALNDEGFLFLGTSETIGAFASHFETVDKKWKLYQKKKGSESQMLHVNLPMPAPARIDMGYPLAVDQIAVKKTSYRQLTEECYSPNMLQQQCW
jgi:two-component system CheB/CheR fusion protein